eukprot:CAMPEP_0170744902 /NCGR_PEP_ID=MMETSP0437-20130122/8021_1 /TAXON_ID=0 /ORGANISM="Sexangularia sp." /LENGTH=223 /DNA_ID=CAMNT_0011083613 /DNA_START=79 /DNA_END=750 /DNA_ORIENTATION=+
MTDPCNCVENSMTSSLISVCLSTPCPAADLLLDAQCEEVCCEAVWTLASGEPLNCTDPRVVHTIALGTPFSGEMGADDRHFFEFTIDSSTHAEGMGGFSVAFSFTSEPAGSSAVATVRKLSYPDRRVFDWASVVDPGATYEGPETSVFDWEDDTIPKISRPVDGAWYASLIGSEYERAGSTDRRIRYTVEVREDALSAAAQLEPSATLLALTVAAAAASAHVA